MDETLRRKILDLIESHRVMTSAMLRPDGWPQATTVGYANDGLMLYFLCGRDSQKAATWGATIASLTVDDDTPQVMQITGLSMAARAVKVVDRREAEKAMRLLLAAIPSKRPCQARCRTSKRCASSA